MGQVAQRLPGFFFVVILTGALAGANFLDMTDKSTIINTINDIAWDLVNESPGIAYDATETLRANGVEPTPQHEAWLIQAVVSESLARLEALGGLR